MSVDDKVKQEHIKTCLEAAAKINETFTECVRMIANITWDLAYLQGATEATKKETPVSS